MASGGEDDQREKRKMAKLRDKDPPHHGLGRIASGSSSAAARGAVRDRGRRDQMI